MAVETARLRADRTFDRGNDLVVCRFLTTDQVVINPHGELTAVTDDQRWHDTDSLTDERSHTGGARFVVSDFAIADVNVGHGSVFLGAAKKRNTRTG